MATYKVTTSYTVTEYVDAEPGTDTDDIAGQAHDRYVSFSDLNMVDYQVDEITVKS